MYKPLPDGLTIQISSIEGLGLFATKEFEEQFVLGVSHIAYENFSDGYIRTPLGGFYNHSDTPNCILHNGYSNSGQIVYKQLVTIKRIYSGEELTAGYTLYEIT